jgi:hypothetical protein
MYAAACDAYAASRFGVASAKGRCVAASAYGSGRAGLKPSLFSWTDHSLPVMTGVRSGIAGNHPY